MKSILGPFGRKSSNIPTDFEIRRLTNRAEIISHLEKRRAYAVSAFAHLEPRFPQIIKWYLGIKDGNQAICLATKGFLPSYLFTMGNPVTLGYLLGSISLPGRTFITCEPENLDVIQEYYEFEWYLLMKRMVVTKDTFIPVSEKAVRIKPSQVGGVNRLFSMTNSGRLTSAQIRRGVFYGIWNDDLLVAVAGTIQVLPAYRIAYLGNVVTLPSYRNQGMATLCVSSVTEKLLEQCKQVVLNVEMHNLPAVRTYTGLGYEDYCQIIEGVGRRKSLIGDIISNVCRKIGLIDNYRERMETDG